MNDTSVISLTVYVTVYGTNFNNFPELEVEDGIVYFWKICGILTGIVIVIFILGFLYMNRLSTRYRFGNHHLRSKKKQ
jgi:uncharacterized membrane protein